MKNLVKIAISVMAFAFSVNASAQSEKKEVVKDVRVNDSIVVRIYEDGTSKTFKITPFSQVKFDDLKAYNDGELEIISLREEEFNGRKTTRIYIAVAVEAMLVGNYVAPLGKLSIAYENKIIIVEPSFMMGRGRLSDNANDGAGTGYLRYGPNVRGILKLLSDRNHDGYIGIYAEYGLIWNKTDNAGSDDRSANSVSKYGFGLIGRMYLTRNIAGSLYLGLGNDGSHGHNAERDDKLRGTAGLQFSYTF